MKENKENNNKQYARHSLLFIGSLFACSNGGMGRRVVCGECVGARPSRRHEGKRETHTTLFPPHPFPACLYVSVWSNLFLTQPNQPYLQKVRREGGQTVDYKRWKNAELCARQRPRQDNCVSFPDVDPNLEPGPVNEASPPRPLALSSALPPLCPLHL